MDEIGLAELGETKWTKEIAMQNEQAEVILRTNTLKTTKEKLQNILFDLDIETGIYKRLSIRFKVN